MNVMSLFAGIGGFDLGLERAGMNVVAQCERDPWCQKVLSKHWPNVPIYDDVTTLTAEKLQNDGIESIDLICGGFPCQPFSVAGNRNGTEDDRHLWPEMLRIIEETRPTWVIGENVAGIISMEQFAVLSKMEGQANRVPGAYDDFEAVYLRKADMLLNGIIEDLEKIGYSVQSFVIPAVAVDAKHRRDRIWIVAHSRRALLKGCKVSQNHGKKNKTGNADKSQRPSCPPIPDVANSQSRNDGQCHTQQDQRQKQQSGIGSSQNAISHTKQQPLRNTTGEEMEPQKSERPLIGLHGGNRNVADTSCKGLPESARRLFTRIQKQIEAIEGRPIAGRTTAERREWPAEPSMGRVANGVPRRVDRLRGLGNAVVPQIPELIGRMIMEVSA